MTYRDISDDYAFFTEDRTEYKERYASLFNQDAPTVGSQFYWIPEITETFAVFLMNSMNLKTDWKKDFERDQSAERWDLINSEGVTVEVKSTKTEDGFRRNSVRTSIKSQRESLILKLFMEKDGMNKMKFVRFVVREEDLGKPIEDSKGKWVNVTDEILGHKIPYEN